MPSAEPEGLRLVEKSNWIGIGLVFPRSRLEEARKRDELLNAGVYVLWGPDESGHLPRVYIGEGETVLNRLNNHANNKDFWTHAAVFTSKTGNLNKAHVQYLEARLVSLAAEAGRAELDNGNVPQLPGLSEADAADAEVFLRDLLLCLPLMGVSFFEKPSVEDSGAPRLVLRSGGQVWAWGVDTAEGFVVRAGSRASKSEAPSIPAHVRARRESLRNRKILEDAGETYRLTRDFVFESPSLAAGVVLGRSANGRTEWRDERTGRTLREIQEAT